jgi:bacterial leucyl aminopeptidase
MKFTTLHCSFLAFALGKAFASPIMADTQWPLTHSSNKFPGFTLNLDEQRLLQFEDGSEVWMTELDKIEAKARGARFFDMLSHVIPSVLLSLNPTWE